MNTAGGRGQSWGVEALPSTLAPSRDPRCTRKIFVPLCFYGWWPAGALAQHVARVAEHGSAAPLNDWIRLALVMVRRRCGVSGAAQALLVTSPFEQGMATLARHR